MNTPTRALTLSTLLLSTVLLLSACGSTPNPADAEAARQARAEQARNAADRAQQQLKGMTNSQ